MWTLTQCSFLNIIFRNDFFLFPFGAVVELGEHCPCLVPLSYFSGPTLRLHEIMGRKTIPESEFLPKD